MDFSSSEEIFTSTTVLSGFVLKAFFIVALVLYLPTYDAYCFKSSFLNVVFLTGSF